MQWAVAKLTLNLTERHLTLSGPGPRAGAPGGKADAMQASRNALATGSKVSIGWSGQMARMELRDPATLALTDMNRGYTILFSKGAGAP